MTPQLPENDKEIIEIVKHYIEKESNPDWLSKEILSIISRLQLALDKCVEQRDAWRASSDVEKPLSHRQENQELQKILAGTNPP